jgi:hypothetical protein
MRAVERSLPRQRPARLDARQHQCARIYGLNGRYELVARSRSTSSIRRSVTADTRATSTAPLRIRALSKSMDRGRTPRPLWAKSHARDDVEAEFGVRKGPVSAQLQFPEIA